MSRNIHPKIVKVQEFIDVNYHTPLSICCLANIASMSPCHFCRTFKKQIGQTCIEYLTRVRIKEAKRLLKTGYLPITQICYMVGFNDLTHFERVFKKLEDCCPTCYRMSLRSMSLEQQNKRKNEQDMPKNEQDMPSIN